MKKREGKEVTAISIFRSLWKKKNHLTHCYFLTPKNIALETQMDDLFLEFFVFRLVIFTNSLSHLFFSFFQY